MSDSLDAYLVLSGMLFAIGSFGFLARRNAISMLMSIELMLNGVNLAIAATDWGEAAARARLATAALAQALFESYVLPFEIISVLLLAAVIGGVYLAKREPGGPS